MLKHNTKNKFLEFANRPAIINQNFDPTRGSTQILGQFSKRCTWPNDDVFKDVIFDDQKLSKTINER